MSELPDNIWERIVGEQRPVTIQLYDELDSDETATSATWTPTSALATYVTSSAAVSANGKEISAWFSHVTAGTVYVNVSVTTSESVATTKKYIIGFKQLAAAS